VAATLDGEEMKRLATTVATIAILVGGGVTYAALAGGHGIRPLGIAAGHHRAHKIGVRGHLTGLYPGVRMPLPARVKNRYPFAVKVRSIRTRVRRASPGCPRRAVKVRRYRGHVRVRAHRARRVGLRIRMRPATPDACQGTTFQLRFKARVRHGGRRR
jgi:hypothetical protein